jgi:hypothetical protein
MTDAMSETADGMKMLKSTKNKRKKVVGEKG